MSARLVAALLAALLVPLGDAGAQQVKFKANLQGPITQPFYGVSLSRFKEEVENRSKGAIAIEIFDKSQLFRDEEVVDAVATGAVDIGTTASQQFARKVPAVGLLDQPFLFNFRALVHAAASPDSELRRLIDDAIVAQIGVRVLWWQPLGDTVFFSKGRDLTDPERFKDQRVAVPGEALEELVTRCGGRPSAITVERFHDSLKDGAVDAAMLSFPALQPRGLWKVTDTVTYTAHSPVEFFLVINENRWQSLSSDHRTLMLDAAATVEREMRDRLSDIEAKAQAFATSNGIKIRRLTPDQVAEWRACSAQMLSDYMERNGDLARRLMGAYAKLRTDPCCMAAPDSVAFTRR
ncbi:MAG: TRAP transporter substrate-binding protein DctP [Hyphomicrobiaceae bacterium]|nr:TRAP transporter substrate-binding protein DctP [Hyphomicrobiaceae bacterium]